MRGASVNVDARKAIQAHLEEQPEVDGDEWLFVGQRGSLLQRPGIYYLISRYTYEA